MRRRTTVAAVSAPPILDAQQCGVAVRYRRTGKLLVAGHVAPCSWTGGSAGGDCAVPPRSGAGPREAAALVFPR